MYANVTKLARVQVALRMMTTSKLPATSSSSMMIGRIDLDPPDHRSNDSV